MVNVTSGIFFFERECVCEERQMAQSIREKRRFQIWRRCVVRSPAPDHGDPSRRR